MALLIKTLNEHHCSTEQNNKDLRIGYEKSIINDNTNIDDNDDG